MSKNYNTRTASLKATIADVRNLDAKKIVLDGKDVMDRISDAEFTSYDTRDPQLKNDELDIWNSTISLSNNGCIEVKPFEHSYDSISSTQADTIKTAVKVIDNEVLGANDTHLMYWLTDGLTNGYGMFYDSTNLATFTSDLSSLINGQGMFRYCVNLTTFSSNLPSLTNSIIMFGSCIRLTSFSSDLPSLENGLGMFLACDNLTSFTSNLPSLTDGSSMFYECRNLTTFFSNLPSLTNGSHMFYYCKLDAPSVANIIHTLSTLETNGSILIGIGCDDTEEDKLLFAQECGCETWQELLNDFSAKNWNVQFQCNGRPTTTYNMRRGATLPVYTKLEEVIMPTDEKERKTHYRYTSTDGSKFYNIRYFHSTNGSTEGYDVFSSIEEAVVTYNVIPKN